MKSLLTFVIAILFASCAQTSGTGARDIASVKEYKDIGSSKIDQKLAALVNKSDIVRIPISGVKENLDNYHLDITLPALDSAEFEILSRELGGSPKKGKGQYKLIEFLPKFAQDIVGQRIKGKSTLDPSLKRALRDAKIKIEDPEPIYTNCHSLTRSWLEMRFYPDSTPLFYGYKGQRMLNFWARENRKEVGTQLPGDILFVTGPIGGPQNDAAYHSAIYLGGGLVLEKIDNDSIYPYRIAWLKDVFSKYKNLSSLMDFIFLRPADALSIPRLGEELAAKDVLRRLHLAKEEGESRMLYDLEKLDVALQKFPDIWATFFYDKFKNMVVFELVRHGEQVKPIFEPL